MPYIDDETQEDWRERARWLDRHGTTVRAALAQRVGYWEAQLADFEPQLAALKADPGAAARLDAPAPDGSVGLMTARGFEQAVMMFRDQLHRAQQALYAFDELELDASW